MQNENLKKIAKQSKRYPFIAEHRGGPLTKDNHPAFGNTYTLAALHKQRYSQH
jgi:hypothetical protein